MNPDVFPRDAGWAQRHTALLESAAGGTDQPVRRAALLR